MKKLLLLISFIFSFLHFSYSQNPLVKQWDKRFGGTNSDGVSCFQLTIDEGYILGGNSYSDSSGDKTQSYWDTCTSCIYQGDYWIVKTDSLANKQWDKDFGGINMDQLNTLQQTADDGYILGGYSMSDSSGDKTQNTWGNGDYWIIKIDSLGSKQWDKDFGGTNDDWVNSVKQTTDGEYMLGGYSSSGISGDKTQAVWGGTYPDYWIIKTDSLGNKQWDKDFGGSFQEELYSIDQTSDGGYLLSGDSYSSISGNKTENNLGQEQTWLIKTDSLGIKQWDKTIFTPGHDENGFAIQIKNRCYTIANSSNGGIGGYKTQPNWDTTAFPNTTYDYWIIKFCDTTSTTSVSNLRPLTSDFSIFPNPANGFITINSNLIAGEQIRITDTLGKLLFTTKIKTPVSNFQFPISNLSPGIYFIKAGNEVRKFVKE